jgi:hypothetical protein
MRAEDLTPEERAAFQEAEFASLLREVVAEALIAGWKAHAIELPQPVMLAMALPTFEPVVQSIVRKVARR